MDYINNFMASGEWQKWLVVVAILVIGYFVSLILRGVVSGAINRTGLGKKAKTSGGNIGKAIGKAVFWLALLYTLFLAFSKAGLGEYFGPVENLFDSIADFIPNLIGAGFTFFIGFIIAKVAGTAVTSVAEAAQVDSFAARTGVKDATVEGAPTSNSLAKGLGTLIFVLIIVPVAIAALDALNMDSISAPLSGMLSGFLDYIPKLIGASIVLGGAIFIGRFIARFLTGFLPTIGFDRSINSVMMLDDGQGMKTSPSKMAGYLALVITLVIGLAAAVDILGNDSLSEAFGMVQSFGGSMLRAAVLIAIGVFLASFMGRFMSALMNPKLANFIKYFVIVLFVFLGLSSLDPEGKIVPVAFSSFVIAASVAAAIAFGLGGRDWAKQVLNKTVPPSDMNKLGK